MDAGDVEAYPCLNILKVLWTNLTKDPDSPKFRTLNTQNKKIASDLLSVDGALKFMLATGWVKVAYLLCNTQPRKEGDSLVFKSDVDHIKLIHDMLQDSKRIREARKKQLYEQEKARKEALVAREKERIFGSFEADRQAVAQKEVRDSVQS